MSESLLNTRPVTRDALWGLRDRRSQKEKYYIIFKSGSVVPEFTLYKHSYNYKPNLYNISIIDVRIYYGLKS